MADTSKHEPWAARPVTSSTDTSLAVVLPLKVRVIVVPDARPLGASAVISAACCVAPAFTIWRSIVHVNPPPATLLSVVAVRQPADRMIFDPLAIAPVVVTGSVDWLVSVCAEPRLTGVPIATAYP